MRRGRRQAESMITKKEYGQAAIVFILMSLVFFWPLFQGRILSQADVLHFFPPWTVQKPSDLVAPSNAVLGDQSREFLTFFQVARESFHRMEFPLWNPYIMTGTPLLADSQSALLFPLNWPFYFLPLFLGFTVSALLKMLIASMGTYAFSRRLSVSHFSAILSGTAYTFSVFNVFWLNHPHTNATIFFPILLLLAETIKEDPSLLPWPFWDWPSGSSFWAATWKSLSKLHLPSPSSSSSGCSTTGKTGRPYSSD